MTIDEAINFFGGQTELAKALGVSRQAVHEWVKNDSIPLRRQFDIEAKTASVLKVSHPSRA